MGWVLGFLWLTRGCHSVYSFPPPTTFPGMLTTGHRSLSTIEQPLPHVSILKCLPASQSGYGQSVILIGTLSVVLFFFFQDSYQITSINLILMMLKISKGQKTVFTNHFQGSLSTTQKALLTWVAQIWLRQTTVLSQRHTQLWLPVWGAPSATPASGVRGTTMLQGRHTWPSPCNCLVILTLWYYLESSN